MVKIKQAGDPMSFEDVLELASTYIKNDESIDLIKRAYAYIMEKHAGQTRKSGEPYTIHLIWVAYILASLQTGPMTITAGLLHDVMEDCDVSQAEMIERFGSEITTLVEGVTKITKMQFKDEADVYAENHRKIYIAMAKDIRVILIKFADRLHNMRTLQYMPEHKQKRIAKETLEVYAPIAHRLGINDIRIELEDLSLYYLDPVPYHEISELLEIKRDERKEAVEAMMGKVRELLDQHHIQYRILGRAKHIYSIYKKMVIKHKRFDELYDLNALRIITDNDKMKCYEVLGIIHEYYRPLPGRFKDYIAMPKPNMYQSLHTAIIGEMGQIFEIQIRTEEMDAIAERGIAAHWRYKENAQYSSKMEQQEIGEKLQWLREFISLSEDIKDGDAKEYYDSLRQDIFEANVYVLSPQGKIIELPNGSTPIDFAYRIHTEVGHHAVGAIVNGVIVPINTALKTGDVVEIKTNKNSSGPSEDWLKVVHTAGARNKIRQFLSQKEAESRKVFIETGKKLLREEVKKRELDEKVYLDGEVYKTYYSSFGAKSFDELLYQIGRKAITAYALLDRANPKRSSFIDSISKMLQKNNTNNDRDKMKNTTGVVVSGMSGLKIQLSKCCNPIPGDEIIGFVSKGQGIKVHRKDCPNVKGPDMKKRLIDVYWDYASLMAKKYEVEFTIDATDRTNLLTDIINTLGQSKINILNIHADVVDTRAIINLKVTVENGEHLKTAFDNLHKVQGIYGIERTVH
ncbi:MAG: RelA/SpoT family protein [Beduini sp.]|uniref:RelA/SpoT family protein n=1 Tax=Beduini sp. TaxID=1922300 RepID=UPI0011CAC0E6